MSYPVSEPSHASASASVSEPELGRILLAEDSRNDVELTLSALTGVGLAQEVIWVSDGQEALDYLYRSGKHVARQSGHPAVVLLDLKMPRVDGLQVLQRVKQDPVLKAVPIVMLTSSNEERDIAASYAFGCNAYVVKHLDFAEFSAAVQALAGFWNRVNHPPPGTIAQT